MPSSGSHSSPNWSTPRPYRYDLGRIASPSTGRPPARMPPAPPAPRAPAVRREKNLPAPRSAELPTGRTRRSLITGLCLPGNEACSCPRRGWGASCQQAVPTRTGRWPPMSRYAVDVHEHTLVVSWDTGLGDVAERVARFPTTVDPSDALQLARTLTFLSAAAWRTYTHPEEAALQALPAGGDGLTGRGTDVFGKV